MLLASSRSFGAWREVFGELTGLVALDPDSSSTAWLSWVYDSTGGDLLDMFGATSEFRFKIDESGSHRPPGTEELVRMI